MTDLYLIAHKVRGEAAFDVATKMECPECHNDETYGEGCVECDQLGFWWIIPTSGHRAYPYWDRLIENIGGEYWVQGDDYSAQCAHLVVPPMPPSLPDHYPTTTPTKGPTLAERLGLTKVVGKITRRL